MGQAGAKQSFDHIIIGAGSAGCVLADRLTCDGKTRVLLLEAGGWDRDPWIHIPMGWGRLYTKKLHDWHLATQPEPQLGGRAPECARGKVIGGSSSINAMAYVRGHRSDYDRWAANGLPGWSFEHCLPLFRAQEGWEGGADAFRGDDGPLRTQASRYRDPLVEAVLAAAAEADFGLTQDYNGARQDGFGRIQSTIKGGRRWSAADAFLRPALSRIGLTVETGAQATRILFSRDRAIGVEYRQGRQTRTAHCEGEVILSGGVINSPQLLMLSGIGDPDELARHEIPIRESLRGVGRNLQDHLSPVLLFRRKMPGPLHRAMRYDRLAAALGQAQFCGEGIASDVPCGVTGFLRSAPCLPAPDVQILLNAAPLSARPYWHAGIDGYADGFGLRVVMLRPESRGRVTLASADPLDAPCIHQNFLTRSSEWATLRRGIRLTRELAARPALAPFMGGEIAPDDMTGNDDAALDRFIRAKALTTHHPLGTCKAGASGDPMAVVDAAFRVFGVRGLRIVDASVMPDMVGGNINATVMMLAEMAAGAIGQTAPLQKADVRAESPVP